MNSNLKNNTINWEKDSLEKKIIHSGNIYIKCSKKNTIISLTDYENKTIRQWSSKSCKKTELKKNSKYNIMMITNRCIQKAKEHKIKVLTIFVKGKGLGRFNTIKHLNHFFKIVLIKDITPIPFNGCRQKKKKRR